MGADELEKLRGIFDIVWAREVPPCILTWIGEKLRRQIWQLRAIPFQQIDCKFHKVAHNPDLRQYECEYYNEIGDKTGGFKGKHIRNGSHGNLHQVIHCLQRAGVNYDNIKVEECFRGYKADILAEIEKDRYIIVELGELSTFKKLLLITDELVKEVWFGDGEKFIYSLSKKTVLTEQMLDEEANRYLRHIANYYSSNCILNRQLKQCLHTDFDCIEIRKEANDLLGIAFLK